MNELKKYPEIYKNANYFIGRIPAFKRLSIIYDKKKDYANLINICNKAITYYDSLNQPSLSIEFEKKLSKANSKI